MKVKTVYRVLEFLLGAQKSACIVQFMMMVVTGDYFEERSCQFFCQQSGLPYIQSSPSTTWTTIKIACFGYQLLRTLTGRVLPMVCACARKYSKEGEGGSRALE